MASGFAFDRIPSKRLVLASLGAAAGVTYLLFLPARGKVQLFAAQFFISAAGGAL
jgi:MFS family permease